MRRTRSCSGSRDSIGSFRRSRWECAGARRISHAWCRLFLTAEAVRLSQSAPVSRCLRRENFCGGNTTCRSPENLRENRLPPRASRGGERHDRVQNAVVGLIAVAVCLPHSMVAAILYGGLGGHQVNSGPLASANDGALAIVDQTNGSVTIVGHSAGVSRITGLTFDSSGNLFASTTGRAPFPPPPPSPVQRSDPTESGQRRGDGERPITSGGIQLSIADLAIQPGTGVLFGDRKLNS